MAKKTAHEVERLIISLIIAFYKLDKEKTMLSTLGNQCRLRMSTW
jgi:CII-binding regulator of phage lambda lysogenization HflD